MTLNFEYKMNLVSLVSSLFLTLGAFFLVRSVLQSSVREIVALCGTYLGSSPPMQNALVSQKAETLVGFAYSLIGEILSIAGSFINFPIWPSRKFIFILVSLCIVLGLIGFLTSNYIRGKLLSSTSLLLFLEHVRSYAAYPNEFNALKLAEDSKKLEMDLKFEPGSDPFLFLEACAVKAKDDALQLKLEQIRKDKIGT